MELLSRESPGAVSAVAAGVAFETSDDSAPNLITAVQQKLGLTLNARRVPVDVLVVDRADPVPVGN